MVSLQLSAEAFSLKLLSKVAGDVGGRTMLVGYFLGNVSFLRRGSIS